jgi:hypothetical protein
MIRFVPRRILALTLVASAPACGGPAPSDRADDGAPIDTAVHSTADPVAEPMAECIDRTEGYAVRYPADWHVNTGDMLGPCALFDPAPIEVPVASELPLEIAIAIGFEPVPFETLAGEVLGRRILSREPTTVDGREAMRIEGESTGEGLHDRGIRSYQYVVDLGDTSMIAVTYDVGEPAFERKRQVLDAMMATLDFRQPG